MADPLTVWTYWEGPCPDYITLCLESMRRSCNLRLLDRAAFEQLWLEDRDLPIDSLYIAHRADFIRAYLLHHYGGAWLDADCIVLRPLVPLAASLDKYDLVYYREPTGTITNNFMIANAQSAVTRSFYEAVVAHVRSRRQIRWLEIGSVPLTAAIESHPDAVQRVATELIMPICWSESERFLEAVPAEAFEDALRGSGRLHNPHAYCYMLSNHSMPQVVKKLSREELFVRPVLLNYLFHVALGDFMSTSMASNYRYWQQSGGDWGSEYDRRKTRHPFFHLQEMMITDHVIHHAPARVLEFGCGTGRHLRNLVQIPGIEAWGFDQSETMLNAGFKWASKDWRAAQLAVGGPTDPLPYEDGTFDVVFSCEALLHTRPEDFQGRLREMARVCRGHILHIESPPSWTGYSPSCSGCWGHDFVAAYSAIGYQCEILAPGFRHQAPYLVKLDPQSVHWTWHPAMLSLYRQLDLSVERGFTQAASPAIA